MAVTISVICFVAYLGFLFYLGKKGKSFGYYYVDGKLKHESTAWMNFKF